MSPRGTPPVVHCCVCGQCHSSASPAVLYRSGDGQWWCRDERACRERHAALVVKMQQALDEVWAELEANGWKLP